MDVYFRAKLKHMKASKNMQMKVIFQQNYSRGELLLRTLFGPFYIGIPHLFLLFFVGVWAQIGIFIAFWSILFTGRYPQSFFEFNVKYLRWNWRVAARLYNLCDGYPPFGLDAKDNFTYLDIPYRERFSRLHMVVKVLFGAFYVVLPHGFVLMFRTFASAILHFIAFWVVMFTGTYPQSFHEFNVGTMRWSHRVNAFLMLMTEEYPPFSGREETTGFDENSNRPLDERM